MIAAFASWHAERNEFGRVLGGAGEAGGDQCLRVVRRLQQAGDQAGFEGADFGGIGLEAGQVEGGGWDAAFGTGTSNFMFLTASAGGTNALRFDINTGAGSQMIPASGSGPQLPTGWQHVAITLSGTTGTMWLGGVPVATNPNMTISPTDLGDGDHPRIRWCGTGWPAVAG